jgi:tetratricopeptide (TPR) repeat protein
VAYGLGVAGDSRGALPFREKALAVMLETQPADSAFVLWQRGAIGFDHFGMARYEEARQIWLEIADAFARNPGLEANRTVYIGAIGAATFNLGRFDEGLRMIEQALDGLMSQYGIDHSWVQGYRRDTIQYLLELGRLDDVAQEIEVLEASYRRRAESRELRLARLQGISRSQLALARGKPRDAEKLVRSALAAWDELRGDSLDRHMLWSLLGSSLIDQRRWAEAREALDNARSLARSWREDELAKVDVKLARIDAATGDREGAHARAKQAASVLGHYPGEILSRKEAQAVLADLGRRANVR